MEVSNHLLNVISGRVGIIKKKEQLRLCASKTQSGSNTPEALKLEPVSESPRGLVKTWVARAHP